MQNKPIGRRFSSLLSATIAFLLLTGASNIGSAYGATPRQFQTSASTESSGLVGKKTASGQRFNPKSMTAASRTLKMGSKAVVTNIKTGAKATVTINDRGPYGTAGRGLDLSKAAADKVGSTGGHVQVNVAPSNGSAPKTEVSPLARVFEWFRSRTRPMVH